MWPKYLSAVETMADNFTDLENSDSTKYYWERLAAESVKFIGKNNRYELQAYIKLSNFYLEKEQLTKAFSIIQAAIELIKTKPFGRDNMTIELYTNLAMIYAARQLYNEAIEAYELAAKKADLKTVDPMVSARFYLSYAKSLFENDKKTEALSKADKSLALYSVVYNKDQNSKVKILLLKSEIHTALNNLISADSCIREAYGLMNKIEAALQIKILKQDARILMLQQKFSAAETKLQKALETAQRSYNNKHALLGEIYLSLAELSDKSNDAPKAISYAIKGQESLLYSDFINLSPICYLQLLNSELKARISQKEIDTDLIEKKISAFFELINRQHLTLKDEKAIRIVAKELLANLISNCIDRNNEKAFYWSEFYKILYRKSLLSLEEPAKQFWTVSDKALTDIYTLKLQKLQLFHELEKALYQRDLARQARFSSLLKVTEQDILKNLSLLKKNQPDFFKRYFAYDIPSKKEIFDKLKGERLLYYFEGTEHYYRFVFDNKRFSATKINREQIDKEIIALLKQIRQKSKKVNSKAISKLILPDLSDSKSLVIIPDGNIWNLPFELLEVDNISVLEKYPLRYIWSASDLFRNPLSKGKDLCFFSTNYKKQPNNRFPQYQRAYKEAQNWSKNLNINFFRRSFHGDFEYNQQASESNFLAKNIKDFALLHLAFFIKRDQVNPLNSSILMHFQPDSIADGVLHLNELSAISLPLSMLTLSNFSDSSGFDDVMATFLLAFEATGSESILYPAWEVENKESSKIIRQYYKNLAAGMTKSEALRNAKITFKDISPYYWASLRLYGQDGQVAIAVKYRFPWLWTGIAAVALSVITMIYLRFRKRKL